MSDQTYQVDPHFLQLVISLQAGAMQQMGKIASPISGKVERNLEVARLTIDMLSMLESKTKGNLSKDEEKLIGHILYELRLNYVDETKKDETPKSQADTIDKKSDETDEATGAESAGEQVKEDDAGGEESGA